jgi:hypothetical protein
MVLHAPTRHIKMFVLLGGPGKELTGRTWVVKGKPYTLTNLIKFLR